jgi:uncharacterized protein involved in exopolysaccharide biosynthesis
MTLGPPGRRDEPLHVFWMALALVLAAFVGGAAGLVWHALDKGDEEAGESGAEAAMEEVRPGEGATD